MAILNQVTLQSGFQAKSTAAEVLKDINLAGKIAIVTGGYSGLGFETVRALASKGAKVIVPVRSETKAKEALAGDITIAPMDLADLALVNTFAASMQSALPQIDFLINNAGVMASPKSKVGPGLESQFGICHMGHFTLTKGLFSLLEKASAPRVVALSSTSHKMSDIQWDYINFEQFAHSVERQQYLIACCVWRRTPNDSCIGRLRYNFYVHLNTDRHHSRHFFIGRWTQHYRCLPLLTPSPSLIR